MLIVIHRKDRICQSRCSKTNEYDILFSDWDSNPSCMVVESSVTVDIIDSAMVTDINLCFDVRL